MRSYPARWRRWVLALVLSSGPLAISGGTFAARSEAADLFGTIDASAVVVRGTVEAVTPYEAAKLQVFRVKVGRVLKGDVASGEAIQVAQEMLFETTKPYFTVGSASLMPLVPLPSFSSFRKVLPEGTYWRWTQRLDTADDIGWLADPAIDDAVAGYVAVQDDVEAAADYFVRTIVGPSPLLRRHALAAIAGRRALVPVLDTGRLAPVAAWLKDPRQPLVERADVMVKLARAGAPGMGDVAEGLLAASDPLLPAALDVVVTLDRLPPTERLFAWSGSPDDALRVAACRGLVKVGTPAALDRIGELLAAETSVNVRVELVKALGHARDPRVVGVLAGQMTKGEKPVLLAAADALAEIGTHDAIVALTDQLEHGRPDAQTAAAFALKRSGQPEAVQTLEGFEQNHADPQVRRLAKLALGESMHEH